MIKSHFYIRISREATQGRLLHRRTHASGHPAAEAGSQGGFGRDRAKRGHAGPAAAVPCDMCVHI